MPQNIQPSTNQILVFGNAYRAEMTVGANATAAEMIPGSCVVYDAADNAVKEAGAKAHDVLGVIDVDATHDMDDTYAVGDPIPILVPAPGAFLMLRVAANENLVQGDKLVSAANGLFAELAVGAMGSQGDVLAVAWETWNVASIEHVLCLWNPSHEPAAAA